MSDAVDPALGLELLRKLLLLRTFDKAAADAYGRKEIHGTYRGSMGQEGIQVGLCHGLRDDDYVSPGLRAVGDILAKGGDPNRLMAELYGRRDGLCGGRGGALHLADAEHGVIGGFAVMTANVPMALGLALEAMVSGNGRVVVCFMGDRATNQGVFHESMNIAALLSLPVVYVGINNAPEDASTTLDEHTAADSMAALAAVHGIDAQIVDGTDVVSVHETAVAVVERLRNGEGPAFLECQCFPLDEPSREQTQRWLEDMRTTGVYEGILAVKKRQIGVAALTPPDHWLAGDPITKVEARLRAAGVTDEQLEAVRADVQATVDAAVAFAAASPAPDPATATEGVFA